MSVFFKKDKISTAFHKALTYNQKIKTSFVGCTFLISQVNVEKDAYSQLQYSAFLRINKYSLPQHVTFPQSSQQSLLQYTMAHYPAAFSHAGFLLFTGYSLGQYAVHLQKLQCFLMILTCMQGFSLSSRQHDFSSEGHQSHPEEQDLQKRCCPLSSSISFLRLAFQCLFISFLTILSHNSNYH